MVETLRELVGIIKELPELSIWILVGLLFYKVVIIGSWFGVARLVILKLHDAYKNPRPAQEVIEKYDFDGIILNASAKNEANKQLNKVCDHLARHKKSRSPWTNNYMSVSECNWLRDAIQSKINEDLSNDASQEKKRDQA